jgi:hypothetical protein
MLNSAKDSDKGKRSNREQQKRRFQPSRSERRARIFQIELPAVTLL